MSDTLIKVENVSKKFCRKLKRSLWYGMKDLGSELIGRSNSHKALRKDEFWAVDDVSFELKRGECLGLIGPNGSGKSTILKMLNGLIKPDKGKITMRGRVGALIELGAGFNPILTGRENIYINGSVLGFTEEQIKEKFESILEFAEIGEFIDTPVQNYSSGMKVRLGFAVAAHMEPDVLLIDEVLAVGDVGFRSKCFNVINKISRNAAIIFVSHQMPQIGRVCSKVSVMDHGKAVYQGGDVPKGIEYYYSSFETQNGVTTSNGKAVLHRVEFESQGKRGVDQINYLDDLTIHLDITVDPEVKKFIVGICFLSREQQISAQCHSLFNKIHLHNTGDLMHIAIKFIGVNLNPSIYSLTVGISDEARVLVLADFHSVKDLRISGDFVGSAPMQLIGEWKLNKKTIAHR